MTALKLRHASTQDQTPVTVSRIVNLINEAYHWSEAELWVDHKERTNALEITALIESGMIILATSNDDIDGVAKVEEVAPDIGGFGMLSTNPNSLGQGIGQALVNAAETWARDAGYQEIEIEIVRGDPPNEHKQFLHQWYTRLGYVEQATYPIAERIPELASLQRVTCVSTVYRKKLR